METIIDCQCFYHYVFLFPSVCVSYIDGKKRNRMDILKAFGLRMRSLRREKGLTQAELAEKCGLSNNFIALLERGKGAPSIATLGRLAEALKVPIAELFEFASDGTKTSEREKLIRKMMRIRAARDLKLIAVLVEFLGKR